MVAQGSCLRQHSGISHYFVPLHIHNLPGSDIRIEKIGTSLGQMDSQDAAPGMTDQDNFVFVKTVANVIAHFEGILNHEFDAGAA